MDKTQVLEEIYRLELVLDSMEAKEAEQAKQQKLQEQQEQPEAQLSEKLLFDLDLEGTSFKPTDRKAFLNNLKAKSDAYLEDEGLKDQIKQILTNLEEQFEQLPSKAVLGVFTAGILFGRILR